MKKGFLVVGLIALMGCGSGGGGGGGTGSGSNGGTAGAGGSLTDLSTAPTGWKTSCIQGSGIQSGTSVAVSGNNVVMTTMLYVDGSSCGTQYRASRITYTGTMNGTSTGNTSATSLDLVPTKLEYIPASAGGASDMNMGSECGKTNWAFNGQWIDVSATSCFTPYVPVFTIFNIAGTVLTLGQTSGGNDGSTDIKRHTTLNNTKTYTKY